MHLHGEVLAVNGQRLARVLIAGAVLAVFAGSGVAIWASVGTGPAPAADDSVDVLGDYGPVPDFSLVERSGRWPWGAVVSLSSSQSWHYLLS